MVSSNHRGGFTRSGTYGPGALVSCRCGDGQIVEAGTLLVALDEDDITPRVKTGEADLADAQAQLVSEKLNHRNDQQALALETAHFSPTPTRASKRIEQLVWPRAGIARRTG